LSVSEFVTWGFVEVNFMAESYTLPNVPKKRRKVRVHKPLRASVVGGATVALLHPKAA
jgi:hypothetical protein